MRIGRGDGGEAIFCAQDGGGGDGDDDKEEKGKGRRRAPRFLPDRNILKLRPHIVLPFNSFTFEK